MSEHYDAAKARFFEAWNTKNERIAKLEADMAVLADRLERANRSWLKVRQAHAVGDPNGFKHHADELTEALTRIQGEYRSGEVGHE